MRFRLTYRGPLASNGSLKQKQALRRAFHVQLRELWTKPPLADVRKLFLVDQVPSGEISLIHPIAGFRFAPLVSSRVHLIAALEILMLRREDPGAVVTHGGDLDNRVKTLLDSFRMPKGPSELPVGEAPKPDEDPFFCLLEDDALVTEVAIVTDRFLEPGPPEEKSHVQLVVKVQVSGAQVIWGNVPLIT